MPSKKPVDRKKAATPVKKTRTKKKGIDLIVKEITALKESYTNLEDRHLRLKAEFDNYRKRKEREILRILKYDGENIVQLFLPVIDDLERILDSVNGEKVSNLTSIADGINMVLGKILKKLKNIEVEPFNSVGLQFDPELHDAIMMQPSEKHGENEIISEFEKGYRYKDRVIRHAKVIVSTGEPEKKESVN